MVTTAFWVAGYWRTRNAVSARSARTRIDALTTIATTGLRMKISVKFMARALGPSSPLVPASTLLGRRMRVVGRPHAVIDSHGRTCLQLDLAAADHLRPGIESGQDRHLIAASGTGGHKDLLHHQCVGSERRWPLARLLRRSGLVDRIRRVGGCSGLIRVECALGAD